MTRTVRIDDRRMNLEMWFFDKPAPHDMVARVPNCLKINLDNYEGGRESHTLRLMNAIDILMNEYKENEEADLISVGIFASIDFFFLLIH